MIRCQINVFNAVVFHEGLKLAANKLKSVAGN